jgi:hypothetical protein
MRASSDACRARIRVAACLAAPVGKAVAVQSLAGGAKRLTYRSARSTSSRARTRSTTADHRAPAGGRLHHPHPPDLTYLNGTVPRVDVIHLHHGVWLNMSASDATARHPGALLRGRRGEDPDQLPKGTATR